MQKISLDELKNYINIKDIISQYVEVTKKNIVLCPFHNDKNPSLVIYPSTNTYYCFGCGKGGDVFTFLMDYKNISFKDAIKEIADYYNVEVENEFNNPSRITTKKISDVNFIINQKFKQNLSNDIVTLNFLKSRKISDNVIDEFELGSSNGLFDYNYLLKNNNLNKKQLIESGCFISKKNKIQAFYSNTRLMIPIRNKYGEIIAFSGRSVNNKNKSKYMNNKESLVFQKKKILFNLDKASEYIKKTKQVIIVEGYFDVFRLYDNDIKNVVAVMGSKLTEYHIDVISRIANEIILAFDGDEAGERALLQSIENILKKKIKCKIITFDNDDPDDFILKYGIEEFKTKIETFYVDAFEYKINNIISKHDINTVYGKQMIVKESFSFSKRVNDNIVTSSIIDILSFKLKIDKIHLNKYFSGFVKDFNLNEEKQTTLSKNNDIMKTYEKRFISALINICNEDVYKDTINKIKFEKILSNEIYINTANFIKESLKHNKIVNLEEINSIIDDKEIINNFNDDINNNFYTLITYAKILYLNSLEKTKEYYTNKIINASKEYNIEEIDKYDYKRKEILQTISMIKTMQIEEMFYDRSAGKPSTLVVGVCQ